MKKLLSVFVASSIVLTACNSDKTDKDEEKKESASKDNKKDANNKENTSNNNAENKEEKAKSSDKKDNEDSSDSKEATESSLKEENLAKEQYTNYQDTENKDVDRSQQINLSNITDKNTLESVIYGNYTEPQKVEAYKSAVANGVIPQGNIPHGPASKAYESSLRIESGQESSIYDEPTTETSNSHIVKEDQPWRHNLETGLSSGETQLLYQIESGAYEGDDEQEIYDALKYYQKRYGN